MFHSKKLGKEINALQFMNHIRKMLEKGKPVSIYHKTLQTLNMEMYKRYNTVSYNSLGCPL